MISLSRVVGNPAKIICFLGLILIVISFTACSSGENTEVEDSPESSSIMTDIEALSDVQAEDASTESEQTIANPNNEVESIVENDTIVESSDSTDELDIEEEPIKAPLNIEFSLADANKTLPSDVFREIVFYTGGGAGAGVPSCFDLEDGNLDSGYFYVDVSFHSSQNTLLETPELHDVIDVVSCGWNIGDNINVSLSKPNGETLTRTLILGESDFVLEHLVSFILSENDGKIIYNGTSNDGSLEILYVPSFEDIEGEYILQIEGNERLITQKFDVAVSNEPQVYNDGRVDDYRYWILRNFSPNERIRLMMYGGGECINDSIDYSKIVLDLGAYVFSCLTGWQEYLVDNQGQLRIKVPDSNDVDFSIIGDESGVFLRNIKHFNVQVSNDWIPWVYDKDALPLFRLSPGSQIRVLSQLDTKYRIALEDGSEGYILVSAVEHSNDLSNTDLVQTVYQSDARDLSEWVFIPKTNFDFQMGSTKNAEYTEEAEQNAHSVTLSEFWVQRTEVSNQEFANCVKEGVCSEPTSSSSETRTDYFTNNEFSDFPIIYVTYEQAQTYCEWIGARLPTEAEWERAVQYPENTYYVWGNSASLAEENSELINFAKNIGDTTSVYDYIDGATNSGLFNVHGNVWEWTSDWYSADTYPSGASFVYREDPTGPDSGIDKVARGGSWSTGIEYISLTNRFNLKPNQGYNNVGFRCVDTTDPNE